MQRTLTPQRRSTPSMPACARPVSVAARTERVPRSRPVGGHEGSRMRLGRSPRYAEVKKVEWQARHGPEPP